MTTVRIFNIEENPPSRNNKAVRIPSAFDLEKNSKTSTGHRFPAPLSKGLSRIRDHRKDQIPDTSEACVAYKASNSDPVCFSAKRNYDLSAPAGSVGAGQHHIVLYWTSGVD